MNRIQIRHRGLLVSGLALWLGASGCRLNNPAFRLDGEGLRDQRDEPEDRETAGSVDTPSGLSTQQPPSGTSALTSQPPSSGSTRSTTGPESPTTSIASTSSGGSGSATSSTGLPASKYCNRGSVYCYPFTESKGQHAQVRDASGRANHLTLQGGASGSGITGGIEPVSSVDEEFKRAFYVTPQGSATAAKGLVYNNESAGFDLWFKPDNPETTGWAIFELDDVLALYRNSAGHYSCASKRPNGALAEAALLVHNDHTFIHIACSIRNGTVSIQVNGGDVTPAHHKAQLWTGEALLRFGKPGSVLGVATLGTQPEYRGRIALLRVWDDLSAMGSATSKDTSDGCGLTKSC